MYIQVVVAIGMLGHKAAKQYVLYLFLALRNRASVVGLEGREHKGDDRQSGGDRREVEEQGQSDLKCNRIRVKLATLNDVQKMLG